jgi:hypothetical protein
MTAVRRQRSEVSKIRNSDEQEQQEYVADGGLIAYATNIEDLYRRAAVYDDKILKGSKPGDLPVEQLTKFELVINLEGRQADRPDDSS